MKQIIERVIDNADHAHQKDQLDRQGNQAGQWIIFFSFEELGLLLGDGIGIPEKLDFNAVERRLHFDHFDGIFLYPNRNGEQNHLGQQGEGDDGDAVIADEPITPFHDIAQRQCQPADDGTHSQNPSIPLIIPINRLQTPYYSEKIDNCPPPLFLFL